MAGKQNETDLSTGQNLNVHKVLRVSQFARNMRSLFQAGNINNTNKEINRLHSWVERSVIAK